MNDTTNQGSRFGRQKSSIGANANELKDKIKKNDSIEMQQGISSFDVSESMKFGILKNSENGKKRALEKVKLEKSVRIKEEHNEVFEVPSYKQYHKMAYEQRDGNCCCQMI